MSLPSQPHEAYGSGIDDVPTPTKRKREGENEEEEEEEVELPPKKSKIVEEEEEEEFFEAVECGEEEVLAQPKRKREEEEEEEEEVDKPPKKLKSKEEEEEEDLFFESSKFLDYDEIPPTLTKELTKEESVLVSRALRPGQSGILSNLKNATVEYKDIYKLYPETWLNDEVINYYMELLVGRAESDETLRRIHCCNTFLYSNLREHGYAKVRRWTRRVDIFAKDLILIPINRAKHWTFGVIDMNRKEVLVYDSLGGNHDDKLELFMNYLRLEHQDKKHMPFDASDWKLKTPQSIPHQENMSDCGVFVCCFAECLARGGGFRFTQQNIPDVRKRIVLNILNKKL